MKLLTLTGCYPPSEYTNGGINLWRRTILCILGHPAARDEGHDEGCPAPGAFDTCIPIPPSPTAVDLQLYEYPCQVEVAVPFLLLMPLQYKVQNK